MFLLASSCFFLLFVSTDSRKFQNIFFQDFVATEVHESAYENSKISLNLDSSLLDAVTVQDVQADALCSLYASSNIADFGLEGWQCSKSGKALGVACNGINVSTWTGVTCDSKYKKLVTVVELDGYGISGYLSNALGNITTLGYLDLSYNSFYGTIPLRFSSLTNLAYLDLSQNSLGSSIPSSLSTLTKLNGLILYNNSFTSAFPSELVNLHLLALYINGNKITSLPTSFGNLSSLKSFFFDYNEITTLPKDITSLSNLVFFSCSYNRIHNFPYESLVYFTTLNYLDIGGNGIGGNTRNFTYLLHCVVDIVF